MQTFKILEDAKPGKGNAGLWWNKFFNPWPLQADAERFKLDEGAKKGWLEGFVESQKGVVDPSDLAQFAQRVSQMVKASQGMVMHFQSTERLTLGLGYEHPMENGFTFHHTLGLPYIPASSVKGLVYAWARYWCEANPTDLTRIFGKADSPKDQRVGSVRFFDALPVKPITFEADVMTPHYGPWYSDGEPPADWHNPVPIGFLTVKAGATFQFALAPRQTQDAADMQQYVLDMQQCAQWLTEALLELGIGAKTAVGYGRLRDVSKEVAELAKRQVTEEYLRQHIESNAEAQEVADKLRNIGNGLVRDFEGIAKKVLAIGDALVRRHFAKIVIDLAREKDMEKDLGPKPRYKNLLAVLEEEE